MLFVWFLRRVLLRVLHWEKIYFWIICRRWRVGVMMIIAVQKIHAFKILKFGFIMIFAIFFGSFLMVIKNIYLFFIFAYLWWICWCFSWNSDLWILPWKSVSFDMNLIFKGGKGLIHIIQVKPYNKGVKCYFEAKSIGAPKWKILMNMCKCESIWR